LQGLKDHLELCGIQLFAAAAKQLSGHRIHLQAQHLIVLPELLDL